MGFLVSKIIDLFSRSTNNFKILILGVQNAGKTTILYRLALGQLVKTTPTIGSNVEEISYKNVKFQAWDWGGQESMRSVWDLYYWNNDGIIYVIDSNDVENDEESKAQFKKWLLNEALKNAVILIFANKQDIVSAKKVNEIIQKYELEKVKDHVWHIQPCSAETGEGLWTGMNWWSDQLIYKSKNNFPNNPYMARDSLDKSTAKLGEHQSHMASNIEEIGLEGSLKQLNHGIKNDVEINTNIVGGDDGINKDK